MTVNLFYTIRKLINQLMDERDYLGYVVFVGG